MAEKSSSTPALSSPTQKTRNRASTNLTNVSTSSATRPSSVVGGPSVGGSAAAGFSSGRRISLGSGGRHPGYARSTGKSSGSLALSQRDLEIEEAEDRLDQWGTRPGGAVERAEREWGLGEDAHMGLS